MPTINQLPSIDEVSGGNQIPTYYSGGGDARKMSVNLLQDYLQDNLNFPDNASEVTYNPAGTSAVARTVESKLRDVVSVKDFGAVGNGVADDTAAIQAAIAYVKSSGGGAVDFPYGNYKVTSSVRIAGNFGFAGIRLTGNNSRIVSTANSPAFVIDAYDGGGGASAPEYRINAVIDGFYFFGPGVGQTSSSAIRIYLSANVLIQNCSIRNFAKGLDALGALICKFENLNLSENGTALFFQYITSPVPAGANDNHFVSCRVWNNTKAVYYEQSSGGTVTFDYCEIEGNNLSSTGPADGRTVIEFFVAGKVTFNGCYIEQNLGQYNLKYVGHDATGSLTFIGTIFLLDGSTGYGIYLDNSAGVPNSLTMIGCSIGTTLTSDLYIGTGFSVSLINTVIDKPITGSVEKLATFRNGRYVAGGYTSDIAPMLLNGSSNGNNIGVDVNGLLRFTSATGSTRYGYVIGTPTVTALQSDSGYMVLGSNSAEPRLLIGRAGTITVEPVTDNNHSLGSAALRWSTVFAGNGTINTSDEREKQDIAALDAAEKRVAVAIKGLVKKFRFKDAVQKKGDDARIHVGVIVQDVMAAFQAEGLDPMRYGIVCYDQWQKTPAVLSDDGTVISQAVPAGDLYGVRYEELLAFVISAL